jgi:hypothetical protein
MSSDALHCKHFLALRTLTIFLDLLGTILGPWWHFLDEVPGGPTLKSLSPNPPAPSPHCLVLLPISLTTMPSRRISSIIRENERLKEEAKRSDEAKAQQAQELEKYKSKLVKAKHVLDSKTSLNN